MILIVLLVVAPIRALAQEEPAADPYLTAAVAALGEQDFALGLQLLERAAVENDDPRITYYSAFALEKLGRCAEAHQKYEAAVFAGPPRFTQAARAALDGFETRCVATKPAAPRPEAPQVTANAEPARRSHTLATVGWVLTTVGGLVLVGVPVKVAFDREIATQSEQYFEQVYECDVNFGKFGPDCDEEEVRSNPQWETYDKRIRNAKRSNVWMIATGTALLAGGITSVVLGSRRPKLAVTPLRGGAAIVWATSF